MKIEHLMAVLRSYDWNVNFRTRIRSEREHFGSQDFWESRKTERGAVSRNSWAVCAAPFALFRDHHDGIGYSSTDYHAGTVPVAK